MHRVISVHHGVADGIIIINIITIVISFSTHMHRCYLTIRHSTPLPPKTLFVPEFENVYFFSSRFVFNIKLSFNLIT